MILYDLFMKGGVYNESRSNFIDIVVRCDCDVDTIQEYKQINILGISSDNSWSCSKTISEVDDPEMERF